MAEDKDPGFIKLSRFMMDTNHPADSDDFPEEGTDDGAEPSKDERVLAGLLYSMISALAASPAEQIYSELIAPAKLHPTIANVQRFKDILLEPEYMGARLLYYTSAAMLVHVCRNLGVDLAYNHIDFKEDGDYASFSFDQDKSKARAQILQHYYGSYFGTVASCFTLGAIDEQQAGYGEAFSYGSRLLREDDKPFAETFIAITMVMLSSALSFVKIIDNAKLNDWCQKCALTESSSLIDITDSGAEYFG